MKPYGAVGVMMAAKAGLLPSSLSSTDVLVLMILADYAGENGQAWPSTETIAKVAHCSRRAVDRSVLVLLGVEILVDPVRRKYLPTRYSIRLPSIEDRQVDDRQIDDRQVGGRGSPDWRTTIATQADNPTQGSNSHKQLEGAADAGPPPSGPRSGVKKTGAARKGSACPAGVDPALDAWLVKEGLPALESDDGAQVERFLDHHHAKGTLSKSWAASWRTWTKYKGRDGSTLYQPNEGPAESVKAAMELARREARKAAAAEAKDRLAPITEESEETKAGRLAAFEKMKAMFGMKPEAKPDVDEAKKAWAGW